MSRHRTCCTCGCITDECYRLACTYCGCASPSRYRVIPSGVTIETACVNVPITGRSMKYSSGVLRSDYLAFLSDPIAPPYSQVCTHRIDYPTRTYGFGGTYITEQMGPVFEGHNSPDCGGPFALTTDLYLMVSRISTTQMYVSIQAAGGFASVAQLFLGTGTIADPRCQSTIRVYNEIGASGALFVNLPQGGSLWGTAMGIGGYVDLIPCDIDCPIPIDAPTSVVVTGSLNFPAFACADPFTITLTKFDTGRYSNESVGFTAPCSGVAISKVFLERIKHPTTGICAWRLMIETSEGRVFSVRTVDDSYPDGAYNDGSTGPYTITGLNVA